MTCERASEGRPYWAAVLVGVVMGTPGCVPQPAAAPVPPAEVAAAPAAVHDESELTRLLELVRERLLLMHDVARWKWNHGLSISDPERERVLLDELAELALAMHLEPEFARTFFEAQIEAGKQVQTADFDAWKAAAQEKFADVPDLVAVQRPALTRISRDLIDCLAKLRSRLGTPELQRQLTRDAERILVGDGIDDRIRGTALAPLLPTR